MKSTRALIYSYFVITNEDDIMQVKIEGDELVKNLEQESGTVQEELHKLVFERKMYRRQFDSLHDGVPKSGEYYQLLKDGLIEVYHQYKISLKDDDTTKSLREIIEHVQNSN